MEGKRVHQISKLPRRYGGSLLEDTHHVVKLLKWLPAGPTSDGGHRAEDLVQFVAQQGGIRTVRVRDLTLL
jgi:hypothetical protein